MNWPDQEFRIGLLGAATAKYGGGFEGLIFNITKLQGRELPRTVVFVMRELVVPKVQHNQFLRQNLCQATINVWWDEEDKRWNVELCINEFIPPHHRLYFGGCSDKYWMLVGWARKRIPTRDQVFRAFLRMLERGMSPEKFLIWLARTNPNNPLQEGDPLLQVF